MAVDPIRVLSVELEQVKDFYEKYYARVDSSKAHAAFCEKVFGMDLCQHGFADLYQLGLLIETTGIKATDKVIDIGSGNGRIAEYLSGKTGAHFTGLDFIPEAVMKARQLPGARNGRLAFMEGDINALDLPRNEYDVVLSIDSIYFSTDYPATISKLKGALRPRGRMGFLYSHGREPWVPRDQFPKETLPPDNTPLAQALTANGLAYTAVDLTDKDYELAKARKRVLSELKEGFIEEDILFVYENRIGDASGILNAIEEGLHRRYLYSVGRPEH